MFVDTDRINWNAFTNVIMVVNNSQYAPIASSISQVIQSPCASVPMTSFAPCITAAQTCQFTYTTACACSAVGGTCQSTVATGYCIYNNADGTCGPNSLPPSYPSAYNMCVGSC